MTKFNYYGSIFFILFLIGVLWYATSVTKKLNSAKDEIIFLKNEKTSYVKKNGELQYELEIARGNKKTLQAVIDSFIISEKNLKKEIGRISNLLSITEYKLSITSSGSTVYVVKKDTVYKDKPYYVFGSVPIRDSLFKMDVILYEDLTSDYKFELYPIIIRDLKYKDGKKTMMKLTTNNEKIRLDGITTFVMDEGKYNRLFPLASFSNTFGLGAALITKKDFLFQYEYKFNTPIKHEVTVGKQLLKF